MNRTCIAEFLNHFFIKSYAKPPNFGDSSEADQFIVSFSHSFPFYIKMASEKYIRTSQPPVDHHGPFDVSWGEISKMFKISNVFPNFFKAIYFLAKSIIENLYFYS